MESYVDIVRSSGYSTNLVLTAFCCWVLCSLILTKDLGLLAATLVSGVKVGLSVVFFGELYQAKWIGTDDVTYWANAMALAKLGVTPWNFFAGSWNEVSEYLDSRHVLYEWWNMLGQYFFGHNYYSAVFLNQIPFFLSGFFICRILALAGFSAIYRALFLTFFIFHWDTIIWTTVLNLKEPLVMFLIVGSIYCFMSLQANDWKKSALSLTGLALFLLAMSYIRFYMVALVVTSIVAAQILNLRINRIQILRFSVLCVACLVAMLLLIPREKILLERFDFVGMFKGTIIFLSSPFPWGEGVEQEMLFIPAIFHWLFLAPTLVGSLLLYKNHGALKVVLIFLAIALVFYGALMAYFGVRQRVQLSFAFAIAQFHFLWIMMIEPALNRFAFKPLVEYSPSSGKD